MIPRQAAAVLKAAFILKTGTNNRGQYAVADRPAAVIFSVDNFVDYYEILHVQDTAPAAVIKASYRAMMQKLKKHPDFGGDVSFAQQLNRAVEVLCNAQARASYDQVRANHLAMQQAHSGTADDEPVADQSVADQSAANNSKPRKWGAPGGSPHSSSPRHSEQDLSADRHGDDSVTGDGNANGGTDTESASGQIPEHTLAFAKPDCCPFCRSPYPAVHPSKNDAYSDSHRCKTCNGATAAVTPVVLASDDHLRRIHRQLHETAARVWLAWPSAAVTASRLTDFSPSGCALQIMNPVAVGQCIMIETHLFNAICRVRHCRRPPQNTSYIIGVEFLTLDIVALNGALLNATA